MYVGKTVMVTVLTLMSFYAYSAEYVSPDIPPIGIIRAMYENIHPYSKIHRIIGTKTTSYGTRYTVHFVVGYVDVRLKGVTHTKRLVCYMLENEVWMIYFGKGQTFILTYEGK